MSVSGILYTMKIFDCLYQLLYHKASIILFNLTKLKNVYGSHSEDYEEYQTLGFEVP